MERGKYNLKFYGTAQNSILKLHLRRAEGTGCILVIFETLGKQSPNLANAANAWLESSYEIPFLRVVLNQQCFSISFSVAMYPSWAQLANGNTQNETPVLRCKTRLNVAILVYLKDD